MSLMKCKKGDSVKVLAGKDKGKIGKVVAVDIKRFWITVEGINLLTRFQRPKKSGQKGQKVLLPMSFPASRVMVICPNCGNPTRVGYTVLDSGRKSRVCKKCKRSF